MRGSLKNNRRSFDSARPQERTKRRTVENTNRFCRPYGAIDSYPIAFPGLSLPLRCTQGQGCPGLTSSLPPGASAAAHKAIFILFRKQKPMATEDDRLFSIRALGC